jgi:hypothetical protein
MPLDDAVWGGIRYATELEPLYPRADGSVCGRPHHL